MEKQPTGTQWPKEDEKSKHLANRMKEIERKCINSTDTKTVETFARLELRTEIFLCSIFHSFSGYNIVTFSSKITTCGWKIEGLPVHENLQKRRIFHERWFQFKKTN